MSSLIIKDLHASVAGQEIVRGLSLEIEPGKVHAIMGGFHLGPAPADYLTQVVAEIAKLNPDAVIPMHCSGLNFTQEAQKQMPGKVLTTTTGTRITFGI